MRLFLLIACCVWPATAGAEAPAETLTRPWPNGPVIEKIEGQEGLASRIRNEN